MTDNNVVNIPTSNKVESTKTTSDILKKVFYFVAYTVYCILNFLTQYNVQYDKNYNYIAFGFITISMFIASNSDTIVQISSDLQKGDIKELNNKLDNILPKIENLSEVNNKLDTLSQQINMTPRNITPEPSERKKQNIPYPEYTIEEVSDKVIFLDELIKNGCITLGNYEISVSQTPRK